MSFKENLQMKVRVDRLARAVKDSIGSVSGGFTIDRDDMRLLLEMAGYESTTRRGLEMYARDFTGGKIPIVLLDNELKIYDTDVDDVLMRKNPTLGEMVRIRSILKILNDKDVVISRRFDTVDKIRHEALERIDLTFTNADVEALYQEASDALAQESPDSIVDSLEIFAEILGLSAPRTFIPDDIVVYGQIKESADDFTFGPVYIYSPASNLLHRYDVVLPPADSKNPGTYKELVSGEKEPDLEGQAVIDDLREKTLALPEKRIPTDQPR